MSFGSCGHAQKARPRIETTPRKEPIPRICSSGPDFGVIRGLGLVEPAFIAAS
jgi:hypothetical protein